MYTELCMREIEKKAITLKPPPDIVLGTSVSSSAHTPPYATRLNQWEARNPANILPGPIKARHCVQVAFYSQREMFMSYGA